MGHGLTDERFAEQLPKSYMAICCRVPIDLASMYVNILQANILVYTSVFSIGLWHHILSKKHILHKLVYLLQKFFFFQKIYIYSTQFLVSKVFNFVIPMSFHIMPLLGFIISYMQECIVHHAHKPWACISSMIHMSILSYIFMHCPVSWTVVL